MTTGGNLCSYRSRTTQNRPVNRPDPSRHLVIVHEVGRGAEDLAHGMASHAYGADPGEGGNEVQAVHPACRRNRQHGIGEPRSTSGLHAETTCAARNGTPDGALGHVIGGLDPGDIQVGPEGHRWSVPSHIRRTRRSADRGAGEVTKCLPVRASGSRTRSSSRTIVARCTATATRSSPISACKVTITVGIILLDVQEPTAHPCPAIFQERVNESRTLSR